MKRVVCFLTLTSVSSLGVFAQNAPKFELYGNYSYMQFNPTIAGLQSRAFNGGGGGFQYNPVKYFGLKADFQGFGSTQWTVDVTSPIGTPASGIIPVGRYTTNANMFTYLFGPVVKVPMKRVVPYGQILFGQSNTNGYTDLTSQVIAGGGTIKASGTQHPFTMAFGGGIDVVASRYVSFRLGEFNYLITRFSNPWTGDNNQNNFRYSAGVVITFGNE